MDKIEKFIRKLSAKEREAVLLLMEAVKMDFRRIPGLMKMQGYENWYRIRVGRYRIIFKISSDKEIKIMKVSKRDENTYKNL